MQQYRFGDPAKARPFDDADGSRAIAFFIFNTEVHRHAYAGDRDERDDASLVECLDRALLACRDRCVFFEHAFSRTREDSDISRAHTASPEPVEVFPQTAELVRAALGYLSLIHISEPTRQAEISYAVFCLKKFFFLMIRRPPRSTRKESSAASDVYKRQEPVRAAEGFHDPAGTGAHH